MIIQLLDLKTQRFTFHPECLKWTFPSLSLDWSILNQDNDLDITAPSPPIRLNRYFHRLWTNPLYKRRAFCQKIGNSIYHLTPEYLKSSLPSMILEQSIICGRNVNVGQYNSHPRIYQMNSSTDFGPVHYLRVGVIKY